MVENIPNARALAREVPSTIKTLSASRPAFIYQVSSSDTPASNSIRASQVEQHLIFRINFTPFAAGKYELEPIIITLPSGEPTAKTPVLMPWYEGSRAEMTSNMYSLQCHGRYGYKRWEGNRPCFGDGALQSTWLCSGDELR